MKRLTLTALVCSSLLASTLYAQGQTQGQQTKTWIKKTGNDRRDARNFRKLRVPGNEVAENIKRLTTEMRWYKTIGGALTAGRSQNKPIVWIHALGDLKGFL